MGTHAVQIAKAFGAAVTGVCSTAKLDLVRSIGADHVVDYTRDDIVELGERYDVVIDIAGNRKLRQLRRALAPKGTLVIVGGEEVVAGSAGSSGTFGRRSGRRSSASACGPSSQGNAGRTSRCWPR